MISCDTPSSKDIQRNESGFPSPKNGGLFMKGRKTDTIIIPMNSKEDLDETDHSIILDNCESMTNKFKRQNECYSLKR
jgi:hypothetical protein